MALIIWTLVISCIILSTQCASVGKENNANDNQQKRELADIGNEYVLQPHDQLAQEQNAQDHQLYQYIQPQYLQQAPEENNEERGIPRTKNLKKIYVIPNESKTNYATMAPQVQVAPVREYNDEPSPQYQHINQQQNYVYINMIPQLRSLEQTQLPQQLFYPNQNVQSQGYAQEENNEYQKYQFVPYKYEHDHYVTQDNQLQIVNIPQQQEQYEQEPKPFLHIRLLPFEPKQKQTYNTLQNIRVVEQYAPQYHSQEQSSELLAKIQDEQRRERLQSEAIAKWEQYSQEEMRQQHQQTHSNNAELIDKINQVNQEARNQAEAYANSQNNAGQYQEQQEQNNEDHDQEIRENKAELLEKINQANLEARNQAQSLANAQTYAPQYQRQQHNKEYIEQLNKINIEKLQSRAQAEAIAKSPPVVVHKEISIIKRRPINIIKTVHVPVPSPVIVPVPQPYEQLIPQPYPVPMEIIRPVIVPIEKTEKIEVEKPVPVEVKKIVEVPVEKKVYYKVEKPVTVEKKVHVEVTKEIPVEIPIYRPQKLTILRHIWEH